MSLYRALAVQSMSVCLSVPQLKCIRSSKWRVCLFYCTSPMQSAVPAAYSVVQSLCSSRGPSATAERFVHVVVFVLHAVFARLAVLAEHSAVSLSLCPHLFWWIQCPTLSAMCAVDYHKREKLSTSLHFQKLQYDNLQMREWLSNCIRARAYYEKLHRIVATRKYWIITENMHRAPTGFQL